MNIFQQYATLYEQKKTLEKRLDNMKPKIIDLIIQKETTELDTEYGTYRLRLLKTWVHTPRIERMAEQLSLAKRVEEITGAARLAGEKWSLTFVQ